VKSDRSWKYECVKPETDEFHFLPCRRHFVSPVQRSDC